MMCNNPYTHAENEVEVVDGGIGKNGMIISLMDFIQLEHQQNIVIQL